MTEQETLNIRVANDTDSEAILELVFYIWVNEYGFRVSKEDFPDLHSIKKSYMDRGGLFLVAFGGEELIGTAACDQLSKGEYVLKRMFVKKSFRGKGIAQNLLEELFKHLPHSCKVYLSTKEDEALAAKAFYLKNGFSAVTRKELPSNFPFFFEDDLFMMKKCI